MAPKVWLITGCSSGFGDALVREALSRGDKVIATARNVSRLGDLRTMGADTLALDLTSSLPELKKIAEEAVKLYGRIDVLVNNAGYNQVGGLEELTPAETQAQFDTNVFGFLNVTRAVLPYMRKQRYGVIGNISSVGAWGRVAGVGLYCASKWAVSGLSESMHEELKEFGIKVCTVEPGYFRSNFLGTDAKKISSNLIDDYEGSAVRRGIEMMEAANGKQSGDIKKGAKVIVDVLTEKDRTMPLRLVLGQDSSEMIRQKCLETIAILDEWKDISYSTNIDE